MRNHLTARWIVLATLGALASIVPTASADTTAPNWTCRASAGYAEVEPLLDEQRVEPVLANGFPVRDEPDSQQCASSATGVQDVDVPEGISGDPLLTANAAFASTTIDPEIAAARDQTASAAGGTADVTITVGAIVIHATVLRADATGTCDGEEPVLSGESTVTSLAIGDVTIPILDPSAPLVIDLLAPLITIKLNQQIRDGAGTDDESLTQRALQIELLQSATNPAANIVLGEAKVDRHGDVCAPEPPPVTPVCPAGSVLQPGSDPAVCVLTVIQCAPGSTPSATTPGTCVLQCPMGSTPDPAAGGACVVVRQAPPVNCPNGTIRDPATNNCILVRERPCPAGSTPDPATRVCVLPIVKTTGSSGENGRIGTSEGPRATCGRLEMHFARGTRNLGRAITSRFGTRTVTRGRLVTCGANPRSIVGARIDVVHVLPNGQRRRKTGLRSRAGGRLTLILPIDLRTRRIEYAYRPDLNTTRVTSRVSLRLTVRNRAGAIVR